MSTPLNREDLISLIELALPDNIRGLISADDLRVALRAFVESYINLETDKVTLDNLGPDVLAVLGTGLDSTKYQGPWVPATNTPTIPTASGNTGKWYIASAAGTASGNAAGTYLYRDVIQSNGTAWLRMPAPPTAVIADASITRSKLEPELQALFARTVHPEFSQYWQDTAGRVGLAIRHDGTVFGLVTVQDGHVTVKRLADDTKARLWDTWGGDGFLLHDGDGNLLLKVEPSGITGPPNKDRLRVQDSQGQFYALTRSGEVWTTSSGWMDVYVDSESNIGGGWKTDGTLVAARLSTAKILDGIKVEDTLGVFYTLTRQGLIANSPTGWQEVHIDSDGWVGWGVRSDGTVVEKKSVAAIAEAPAGNILSERCHVLATGQSLSLGSNNTAITTDAHATDKMFSGGMWPQHSASPDYSGLVGAAEQTRTYSSITLGETPLRGFSDKVRALLTVENQSPGSFGFLMSASGTGSSTLAQLSVSPRYTTVTDHLSNGYSRIAALNEIYGVPVVLILTGESDSWAGVSRATFKSSLRSYCDQIAASIQTTAPGSPAPVFICHQVNSHRAGNQDFSVGLAVVDAANTWSDILVAAPCYFLPDAGDGIHLSGAGSRWWAGYAGLAFKRKVIDQGTWKFLQPVSARRQADKIFVVFDVPVAPLVIDTTTVPSQSNYGFTLVDSGGTNIAVSGVTLVGPKTLKMTAVSTVPANAKLRYGWGTNGVSMTKGNIRDSAGEKQTQDISGLSYPLHNWLVHSETIIP